jgi:hypothetical protein
VIAVTTSIATAAAATGTVGWVGATRVSGIVVVFFHSERLTKSEQKNE